MPRCAWTKPARRRSWPPACACSSATCPACATWSWSPRPAGLAWCHGAYRLSRRCARGGGRRSLPARSQHPAMPPATPACLSTHGTDPPRSPAAFPDRVRAGVAAPGAALFELPARHAQRPRGPAGGPAAAGVPACRAGGRRRRRLAGRRPGRADAADGAQRRPHLLGAAALRGACDGGVRARAAGRCLGLWACCRGEPRGRRGEGWGRWIGVCVCVSRM